MEHYKTVMFVQISERQAPLHKCKAPLLQTFLRFVSEEESTPKPPHTKLFISHFFGNND